MHKTCGPVFVVSLTKKALIYRRMVCRPNVKMLSTPLEQDLGRYIEGQGHSLTAAKSCPAHHYFTKMITILG